LATDQKPAPSLPRRLLAPKQTSEDGSQAKAEAESEGGFAKMKTNMKTMILSQKDTVQGQGSTSRRSHHQVEPVSWFCKEFRVNGFSFGFCFLF
jgi:hypothetical protein